MAMSADGSKIAVGSWAGKVWLSSDFGKSWTKKTAPGDAIAMSSDGSKIVAGEERGNLYTSSDGGATWTEDTSVGETKRWSDIAMSSDGSKVAAIAHKDHIWMSSNGGRTWTQDVSVGETQWWQEIVMSSDGSKLAAAVSDGGYSGSIWTSSDAGETWVKAESSSRKDWQSITMSSDGSKLAACEGDGIYEGNLWGSADGGSTWLTLSLPCIRLVRASSNFTTLITDASLGSQNGIFVIDVAGGNTWKLSNTTSPTWTSLAMSPDASRVVAGTWHDGGLWITPPPLIPDSGTTASVNFGGDGATSVANMEGVRLAVGIIVSLLVLVAS